MPAFDAELRARLQATFREEAAEHLQALESQLSALEAGPPDEEAHALVEETFRVMHTLKGAARSVGATDVEQLCQESETALSRLSRARRLPDADELARFDDDLRRIAALVSRDAAAPAPKPEPRPAAPPRPDAIRMSAGKLDDLLRRGEDLLAIKLAADEWVEQAQALSEGIARYRAGLDGAGAELRELEANGRAVVSRLRDDRRMITSAVDSLLDGARRARLTPAATLLERFPLMVRDLARSTGKLVEWSSTGGELEVDRRVLEAVQDPLIHLVRNAVDHGIEPSDERTRAGKPARGSVQIDVRPAENGRVEFAVSDDGRGIDVARVRAAAERARVTDPSADALDLVLRSGVSTSFVVTDISGRGLGLAIVAERLQRIGGELQLDNRPGQGLTVRLLVPTTIATFRGLPVRAGGQLFLLPVASVERVVPVGETNELPVAGLDDVLELTPAPLADEQPACAIISVGEERAAVRVDEVLSDREVIVKEFPAPLVRVRNIAAAGLAGAGELLLILRPADIVRGVQALVAAPVTIATVLVVDDAATTRALEQDLLERAGYRVEVATNGREAWEALEREPFDLVVSDVDMPELDGFALTERIRADARFSALPVVLVTALEGTEDVRRGLAAGASAYVVKSRFDATNLLDTIRRLGVLPGADA